MVDWSALPVESSVNASLSRVNVVQLSFTTTPLVQEALSLMIGDRKIQVHFNVKGYILVNQIMVLNER